MHRRAWTCFAAVPNLKCARHGCERKCAYDDYYCSDRCFDLDNDPTPVTVNARNKAGGFGHDLHWSTPDPVHVPYVVCFIKKGK